jgi:UDP-N-acetylglucosamine:LPS N-acetylglucosamine transferase
MPFIDVLASSAAVLTKPGYGTYAEAVCNGIPVLTVARPDWPETRYLNDWARGHGRIAEITRAQLEQGEFADVLEQLWRQPVQPVPAAAGAQQAADIIQACL